MLEGSLLLARKSNQGQQARLTGRGNANTYISRLLPLLSHLVRLALLLRLLFIVVVVEQGALLASAVARSRFDDPRGKVLDALQVGVVARLDEVREGVDSGLPTDRESVRVLVIRSVVGRELVL